jgi:hypothetical protein
VMTACLAATAPSAHRLDEYLQAARLAVDISRVELQLELTPGVAVADAIISDLDRDRDGHLSTTEQSAYMSRVFDDLTLAADGRTLRVRVIDSSFPDLSTLRAGEGTIIIRSGATLPQLSPGVHRLFFRNAHRRDASVYLANVLAPRSPRIAIVAQRRDANQRELTIDYVVRG